ncbi:Pentatricopeptide repeat [Dillenia turbinata]|uniref:Pentatricopeptide repeat n=2 Tax=Dillenia turbinata TaxID=194707 RepID=A0AAN8USM9_9MAGN
MNVRWPRVLTPTLLKQILKAQKNPQIALQIFNTAKSKYPNYHHNGLVYSTILNILGQSHKFPEMKQVISEMKHDSCEVKDSLISYTIKTYANAGLLNDAVSLFNELPQFNCINWTNSLNTLLEILLKRNEFEIAYQIFLEKSHGWEVKSRVGSMNLVIGFLCESKKSILALEVFDEMLQRQCCFPNRETYRILMKGLCDENRLTEATHLLYSMFWRISQKGSGEDVVIYRTLLNALCDDGKVEEAVELLEKILRKGLKAPKQCRKRIEFDGRFDGYDIEEVKRYITEALFKGGVPSSSSFSAMAIDLYSEGKIGDGNRVINEMCEKGFRPKVLVYEAKVAALCREGRVGEAVNVIEKEIVEGNSVPTVRMYNEVIKGLCDEGRAMLAARYLHKMARKADCVADKNTYSIIVHGLCREDRFVEASRVLEKMLNKSYWPCVHTFNVLIKGLCSVDRRYEAVMWLEEMISQDRLPELSVWEALVASAYQEVGETDVWSKTFTQLANKVALKDIKESDCLIQLLWKFDKSRSSLWKEQSHEAQYSHDMILETKCQMYY